MVYVIILTFIGIAYIDAPKLFKNELWGELAAYSFLFITGFTLSLLLVTGVKVASPNEGIAFLIEAITKSVSG